MLASVSRRVVSWNEAAEMKLSVDRDALVMPSRSGVPSAGSPPRFITLSFSKTPEPSAFERSFLAHIGTHFG